MHLLIVGEDFRGCVFPESDFLQAQPAEFSSMDFTAGMVLRGLNYRVRLGAARCQHVFVVIFPELSLGIGYPCRTANSRYLSSRMAFSSTKNITQQNLPLCLTKAEDPRLASKWNVSIACQKVESDQRNLA